MKPSLPVTSSDPDRALWPFVTRRHVERLLASYREQMTRANDELDALMERVEAYECAERDAHTLTDTLFMERDRLHDYALDLDERYGTLADFITIWQDDAVASIVRLKEQLNAAQRTQAETQRHNHALAEEIANLHSQLADRNERITELESRLSKLDPPRKRHKKQDAAPVIASESEAAS